MVVVAFIVGCVLILAVMVILSACVVSGRHEKPDDKARAEMLRRGGWK